MKFLAFTLLGLGALIAGLNFYLSFVKYPLHRLFHQDQPFKFVSGLPLIGSILLWIGAYIFLSAGAAKYAALALIVSLFDPGGIQWFLIMMGYQWIKEWRVKGEA